MQSAVATSSKSTRPGLEQLRAEEVSRLMAAHNNLVEIQGLMSDMQLFFERQDMLRNHTLPDVPARFVSSIVRITELGYTTGTSLENVPGVAAPGEIVKLGSDIAKLFDPSTMMHPKTRLFGFGNLQRYVEYTKEQIKTLGEGLSRR